MQEGHHALGIPLYGGWADFHQLAEAAEADRWDFWGLTPEVLTSLLQQDQRRLWEISGRMVRLTSPPANGRRSPSKHRPRSPYRHEPPEPWCSSLADRKPNGAQAPRSGRRHVEPSWKTHGITSAFNKGARSASRDNSAIKRGALPAQPAWPPPPPPRPRQEASAPDATPNPDGRRRSPRLFASTSKAAAPALGPPKHVKLVSISPTPTEPATSAQVHSQSCGRLR